MNANHPNAMFGLCVCVCVCVCVCACVLVHIKVCTTQICMPKVDLRVGIIYNSLPQNHDL